MKLVDTSSWVHHIRRKGDPAVRARVEQLLRAGEATWCPTEATEVVGGRAVVARASDTPGRWLLFARDGGAGT